MNIFKLKIDGTVEDRILVVCVSYLVSDLAAMLTLLDSVAGQETSLGCCCAERRQEYTPRYG